LHVPLEGDDVTADALPGRKCRVLVVDDDDELRWALSDMLSEYGFEVVGLAADGEAAVDSASALRPNVVLMDVRMPKMDGIDATRLIRERLPKAHVIALSAYEDPALAAAARSAGADDYVTKGTAPELLCDIIQELVGPRDESEL
jgi:CheY-like chemotaxis protein